VLVFDGRLGVAGLYDRDCTQAQEFSRPFRAVWMKRIEFQTGGWMLDPDGLFQVLE
jgi:hypothetical protein